MSIKFDWNTIKFYSDTLKEFMWTKKIKSVNEKLKLLMKSVFGGSY